MPPLCLFYFSHPFGILSPDPPTVTQATPDCFPPSWNQSYQSTPWRQQPGIRVTSYHASRTDSPTQTDPINYPKTNFNIPATSKHIHCHQDKTCTATNKQPTCYKNHQTANLEYRCVNKNEHGHVNKANCCAEKEMRGDIMKSRTADWKNKDYKITNTRGFSCVENSINDTWSRPTYDSRYLNCERSNIKPSSLQFQKLMHCKSKTKYQRQPNFQQTLPPLERSVKHYHEEERCPPVEPVWPGVKKFNNFRTKAYLPPLEFQHYASRQEDDNYEYETSEDDTAPEPEEKEFELCLSRDKHSRKGRRRKERNKRHRKSLNINSSRGVNKGRVKPNRSAARKLASCLIQSVHNSK